MGDTSGHTKTRVFVGPKAVNVLRADPRDGQHRSHSSPCWTSASSGRLASISSSRCSSSIRNRRLARRWGWAIIILTVIINVLLLPLRIKTMQSGLKMQRIQPQMNEIKEKYKKYKATDPKRNEMNVEIMKLQKDNGVNMFGGCIPTLIQFPLLMPSSACCRRWWSCARHTGSGCRTFQARDP